MNGPLPPELADRPALTMLQVRDCGGTGTVLLEHTALTHLGHLDLYGNSSIGAYPDHLTALTALQVLYLAFNSRLTGQSVATGWTALSHL